MCAYVRALCVFARLCPQVPEAERTYHVHFADDDERAAWQRAINTNIEVWRRLCLLLHCVCGCGCVCVCNP